MPASRDFGTSGCLEVAVLELWLPVSFSGVSIGFEIREPQNGGLAVGILFI